MEQPKIGVYVCDCGVNIAATVNVPEVVKFASGLPNVTVAREYKYMCSEPGQKMIKEDIQNLGLTRVVVAACSPRMHEPTFQNAVRRPARTPITSPWPTSASTSPGSARMCRRAPRRPSAWSTRP